MTTQGQEFNVAEFMNENIDAQFDTAIIPIPEGEHIGQIGTDEKAVEISYGISQKNNKPWMRADIRVHLTDPNLAIQLQRQEGQEIVARYGLMIDLDEQGKLDTRPQRNVNLGKLRDAVGQNQAGPWNFSQLKGRPIKVKIKHKLSDDGNTYSNVTSVTKAV